MSHMPARCHRHHMVLCHMTGSRYHRRFQASRVYISWYLYSSLVLLSLRSYPILYAIKELQSCRPSSVYSDIVVSCPFVLRMCSNHFYFLIFVTRRSIIVALIFVKFLTSDFINTFHPAPGPSTPFAYLIPSFTCCRTTIFFVLDDGFR